MNDYENDTLNAYRTRERAKEYKVFHTSAWTWGRLVTWFEQWAINRVLRTHRWSSEDKLLDIPCGTGILGKLLNKFPFKIIASDISDEMMELAKEEYPAERLISISQQDITKTMFPDNSFECIITLGFLHRVPIHIKRDTLNELYRISNNLVIVSSSVDSLYHRIKHRFILVIKKGHIPAPCPMPLNEIRKECESVGFKVLKSFQVLPVFSSHAIFVLRK